MFIVSFYLGNDFTDFRREFQNILYTLASLSLIMKHFLLQITSCHASSNPRNYLDLLDDLALSNLPQHRPPEQSRLSGPPAGLPRGGRVRPDRPYGEGGGGGLREPHAPRAAGDH